MGTKIGLAGDWHCDWVFARHAIATFAEHEITDVFQLGDFGLGWPRGVGDNMLTSVEASCRRFGVNLYIVPGNHENWEWISKLEFDEVSNVCRLTNHVYVLGRGFRGKLPDDRTVVALGGAPSIDFPNRTEYISWWKNEMITLREAEEVAAEGYADIFLAHDAPDGGTKAVQDIINTPPHLSMWTEQGLRYAREGRELMNIAFQGVKPKVFAHGHFHVWDELETEDTKFLSLNMNGAFNNMAALDCETLEHEWLELIQELPPAKVGR